MSTETKDYLTRVHEDFFSSRDGEQRVAILEEVMAEVNAETADILNSHWKAEYDIWCETVGVTEEDLFQDEEGRLTYQDVIEIGTAGEEGYNFREVRRRVPEYLDITYCLNNYSQQKHDN